MFFILLEKMVLDNPDNQNKICNDGHCGLTGDGGGVWHRSTIIITHQERSESPELERHPAL